MVVPSFIHSFPLLEPSKDDVAPCPKNGSCNQKTWKQLRPVSPSYIDNGRSFRFFQNITANEETCLFGAWKYYSVEPNGIQYPASSIRGALHRAGILLSADLLQTGSVIYVLGHRMWVIVLLHRGFYSNKCVFSRDSSQVGIILKWGSEWNRESWSKEKSK